MGNSTQSPVAGIDKVMIKLTSGKTVLLGGVLHVPDIRENLIFVSCLIKAGVKVSFESDRIIMSRAGMFIGSGYVTVACLFLVYRTL